MKATNSVSVSLTPKSQPALPASDQSTPISQARGMNIQPSSRSTVTGASNSHSPPIMRLTRATRATNTISTAEMFSTTIRPSAVPLTMASMAESYLRAEP